MGDEIAGELMRKVNELIDLAHKQDITMAIMSTKLEDLKDDQLAVTETLKKHEKDIQILKDGYSKATGIWAFIGVLILAANVVIPLTRK